LTVVLDRTQVEHVMPQTLSEAWRSALGAEHERVHSTWLHTPGNLTLTGYNAELNNKPFASKREEYRESNLVMTRELARYESWGESQIIERGRAMAEVAARVWPGPTSPVRRSDQGGRGTPSRYERRLKFWGGFRGYLEGVTSPLKPGRPRPYYSLSFGRLARGVVLYGYLNLKNERLAVSVYFDGEAALRAYQKLREHRDAVEAEVGSKLLWTQGSARKSGEILLRNPVDPTDEALWPAYYDWMRRSLETFHAVLGPRVAPLLPADVRRPTAGPTATGKHYLDYWSAFRADVERSGSPVKPQKPSPQYWTNFTIGRTGFYLSATAPVTKREIAVYLILHGPTAKTHFHLLVQDRPAIEAELGQELEWYELPGKKRSHVVFRRRGVDPTYRDDWPEQHAWFREWVEAFTRVFGPRVKSLDH
jgi:hypothetical protein